MKFEKSSQAAVDRFGELLPAGGGVERRTMFGYPCGFVGGHLFCGLFVDDLFLRLDERGRGAAAKSLAARPFEPLPGRVMKEYVVVPGWMGLERGEAARWVARSLAHARTLPPKAKAGTRAAARKNKK